MLPHSWTCMAKRCPTLVTTTTKLLPFVFLGFVGFLYNTQHSLLRTHGMCSPRNNIVFLKTHKCAGSSIQNVLMRYGDVHKLRFVLPRTGNYMGHPAPFSSTMVAQPRLSAYNILAHHTRLDYREIQSLMPGDSVYITIVRDPIEVFESAYSYYGLGRVLGGSLHRFLAKVPSINPASMHRRIKNGKFGSNQMMFDLGADPEIFGDEAKTKQYIEQLDSWFHLVMISDRMEESLVLLRHLLCWDTDDVITFKINARDPRFKSRLNDTEKDILRRLNRADVLLYEHFVQKFQKTIDDFGRDRMAEEVEQLRDRNRKWYSLCVKGEQRHEKSTAKPKYYTNSKVMVFKMNAENNSTCRSMTMEELPYTDILRKRQQVTFRKLRMISRRVPTESQTKS